MRKKVIGKPCEGELHARIDEELLVKSEEETSDLLYVCPSKADTNLQVKVPSW